MTNKPRILIIEDDRNMIELYSLLLQQDGYETISAMGGQEALSLLEETTVDLILLDLMMPVVDGWTVLRSIRENDKLAEIPVIIATIKDPLADPREVEAHAGLFEGYLVKPFIVHDLLTQIRKALK
jgi:two-component system response regulator ResD